MISSTKAESRILPISDSGVPGDLCRELPSTSGQTCSTARKMVDKNKEGSLSSFSSATVANGLTGASPAYLLLVLDLGDDHWASRVDLP